jgi:hypothetical protein
MVSTYLMDMRTPLRSLLLAAAEKHNGVKREKTSFMDKARSFLAADASQAQKSAQQLEWGREYLKGCPAIAAAVTPLHYGMTQHLITPLLPKDKPAAGLDVDTLAAIFSGSNSPSFGAGMAGASRVGR